MPLSHVCLFSALYTLCRMSRSSAKKWYHSNEEAIREFKEYWTEKFRMFKIDNKALCIFCSGTIVYTTSSVKRHFERILKNLSDKTEEEQREVIPLELSKTKRQKWYFYELKFQVGPVPT